MNGIILIDKPAGMTSFGVVARVRRVLSLQAGKKVKVGHTGTLDPSATGLMIVVVGDYCKRAQEFSKLDKTYEATMYLGSTSTTGDPEGEIIPYATKQPTETEIEQVFGQFRGHIQQTPPAYSAIKIGGKRAYKLARSGEYVELPERPVTISKLELLDYRYPTANITCHVSSGTYIRSLVEAIGIALGTGAYTLELRRVAVGKFTITQAVTLAHFMSGEQRLMTV